MMHVSTHERNQAVALIMDDVSPIYDCTAKSNIIIRQRDLQFDHPMTAVAVTCNCSCPARNVRLFCDSEWLQAYVNATNLQVLGDGLCALAPSSILTAGETINFTYGHSPPLNLTPAYAMFDCGQSSAGGRLILPPSYSSRVLLCIIIWLIVVHHSSKIARTEISMTELEIGHSELLVV